MRIGAYTYHYAINDDTDGINVRKISRTNNMPDIADISGDTAENDKEEMRLSQSESLENKDMRDRLTDTKQAVDMAVNRFMNKDKSLIGSSSSLESLDVQKAVSDLQKDSILKEYQSFVNTNVEEDGFVRKIR